MLWCAVLWLGGVVCSGVFRWGVIVVGCVGGVVWSGVVWCGVKVEALLCGHAFHSECIRRHFAISDTTECIYKCYRVGEVLDDGVHETQTHIPGSKHTYTHQQQQQ